MHDYDGDWYHDEIVNLDADVTGDPQLDQFGYQSPRRDFSPPPSEPFDYLAQFKRDMAEDERRRAAVQDNLDQTRRRNAERRGGPSMLPPRHCSGDM